MAGSVRRLCPGRAVRADRGRAPGDVAVVGQGRVSATSGKGRLLGFRCANGARIVIETPFQLPSAGTDLCAVSLSRCWTAPGCPF